MKFKNALFVILSFISATLGVLLFVSCYGDYFSKDVQDFIVYGFFISFIVMVAYAFVTSIFALVSSINNPDKIDIKGSLVTKILMIPFFLVNFAIWFTLVFGMALLSFTPIPGAFILGIPAVIVGILSCSGTYIIMISTSINLIVPFIKKLLKKEAKIGGIIGTILLFVFCLDAVGAGILASSTKRNNNSDQHLSYQP